jgi:MHS family proline/betaine transporter-like MFS transporter
MFLTFCVGGVASSVLYLVKTYVNVFYHNVMHLDNTIALAYLSYTSVVSMIAMPIAGAIADRIGRFQMIVVTSCAVLILALPTLLTMSMPQTWQQIAALTMLGILGGAISGAAYIFIISLFTPEQKFSGVAFSYNLGIAMFGGTSPIISRWLVEITGLFYAPSFYIMTTSTIFLLIIYFMRDVIKRCLKNNG